MAAASKAGSFRLGKYKSNGISVELIRTRMEDLALECQRRLRREHVAKRRNIDVLLEELERTNASEGKVAEKTATEGSNSHEPDANAGESDDANAGESDDAKAGESDDADHSSEEAPSPKDNGENNAEKNDEITELAKQVMEGKNRYEAIQMLRRKVSVERSPPLDEVINTGIIPSLVQCLDPVEPENLQVEAAWVLTNIASGNNQQTAAVVKGGAVPRLVQLLQSHDQHIRDQVLWALGNISGDCPAYRDIVVEYGIVDPLLEILGNENEETSLRRNASWTLSNLCRHRDSPLPSRTADKFLPVLNSILPACRDKAVLTDCLWSVAYLFEFDSDQHILQMLDTGIFEPVVKILGERDDESIIQAGLRVMGNITSGNDQATQVVVDNGGLAVLLNLMQYPRDRIQKEVFWALSNVAAGTVAQKQAVVEAKLLDPTVEAVIESCQTVQKEALWTLTNLTEGAPESIVQTVLDSGGLRALGSAVCYFETLPGSLKENLLTCLEQVLQLCPSDSHYLEAIPEGCVEALKELCKDDDDSPSPLEFKARRILYDFLTPDD